MDSVFYPYTLYPYTLIPYTLYPIPYTLIPLTPRYKVDPDLTCPRVAGGECGYG